MTIETLNTINDGLYLSMMLIKVVMLIFILATIGGLVVYLAGVVHFCTEEKQKKNATRRTAPLGSPPNPPALGSRLPVTRPLVTLVGEPNANA